MLAPIFPLMPSTREQDMGGVERQGPSKDCPDLRAAVLLARHSYRPQSCFPVEFVDPKAI